MKSASLFARVRGNQLPENFEAVDLLEIDGEGERLAANIHVDCVCYESGDGALVTPACTVTLKLIL